VVREIFLSRISLQNRNGDYNKNKQNIVAFGNSGGCLRHGELHIRASKIQVHCCKSIVGQVQSSAILQPRLSIQNEYTGGQCSEENGVEDDAYFTEAGSFKVPSAVRLMVLSLSSLHSDINSVSAFSRHDGTQTRFELRFPQILSHAYWEREQGTCRHRDFKGAHVKEPKSMVLATVEKSRFAAAKALLDRSRVLRFHKPVVKI